VVFSLPSSEYLQRQRVAPGQQGASFSNRHSENSTLALTSEGFFCIVIHGLAHIFQSDFQPRLLTAVTKSDNLCAATDLLSVGVV
jgi:hypothetical protein